METGEDAELFIQQLRRTVRYLGVCDGNMEMGSLRADANISINLPGKGLGRKVEIKNLNSSRFVRLGLNYEIGRQGILLDEGKTVTQETRLWNENRDQTEPMRSKENAHDYRYFPEPDIPVFMPDAAFLKRVDDGLCELPLPRARRLAADYGLGEEQAGLITEERALADYFEAAVAEAVTASLPRAQAGSSIAKRLLSDIKHILSAQSLPAANIAAFRLTPKRLAAITVMVEKGEVSAKNARQAIDIVIAEDREPAAIIAEKGWAQLSDPAQLAAPVATVLQRESATVEELRQAKSSGNQKREATLSAYLVGKVIAETKGRASPEVVKKLLAEAARI
jgi:aspartyl-tRNA(Asn)/glutamyl-tRNA(Gln) amidotransferase subunit B